MSNNNDALEQRLKSIEKRLQVLDDQQAIIKLKAQYVNYNDGGWEEQGPTHSYPDAVAEMFTDDAVWDGRPKTGYAEGKEAIRQLFNDFKIMPYIIHYVSNPLIEVDGDTATGHWHALVTATMPNLGQDGANGQARWVFGMYKEEYLRTADGWKIKKLRFEHASNTDYDKGWALEQFS